MIDIIDLGLYLFIVAYFSYKYYKKELVFNKSIEGTKGDNKAKIEALHNAVDHVALSAYNYGYSAAMNDKGFDNIVDFLEEENYEVMLMELQIEVIDREVEILNKLSFRGKNIIEDLWD